jgi:hypothetical protein
VRRSKTFKFPSTGAGRLILAVTSNPLIPLWPGRRNARVPRDGARLLARPFHFFTFCFKLSTGRLEAARPLTPSASAARPSEFLVVTTKGHRHPASSQNKFKRQPSTIS